MTYSPTRDTIINRALRICGAYDQYGTPGTTQVTNAALAFNDLIMSLQSEEEFPWLIADETETWTSVPSGSFGLPSDTISIVSAFFRDSDDIDHPLNVISYGEYLQYTAKEEESDFPVVIAMDNSISPNAYIWPQLSDDDNVLHYQRVKEVSDFTSASSTPDFRNRWIRALTYLLADDLADEYKPPVDQRAIIARKAETLKLRAQLGNANKLPIRIQPRR
jgi:hypothetical protein